jgi:hypothetical protein
MMPMPPALLPFGDFGQVLRSLPPRYGGAERLLRRDEVPGVVRSLNDRELKALNATRRLVLSPKQTQIFHVATSA